jgi:3-dehydroquinate synthase
MRIPMPNYDIYVENHGLSKLKEHIHSVYDGEKLFIISDERVFGLHGKSLELALEGFSIEVILVKPGESSKSLKTYQQVVSKCLQKGIKRDHLMIAFGGGVVGDLTGFCAATLLRGIPYIQVPTTLLAQVDSSIGSKVGIDLLEGKNLIGAFYEPKLVFIELSFLETLKERQYRSGLAEMIKAGLIKDKSLFHDLQSKNKVGVEEIIKALQVKRAIVINDPFEKNERMLLNFGHTYGHAIEKAYHYRTYTHGEAIAYGMLIALKIGIEKGYTSEDLFVTVKQLFLNKKLVKEPLLKREDFTKYLKNDKKHLSDGLHFIVLKTIGEASIIKLEEDELS